MMVVVFKFLPLMLWKAKIYSLIYNSKAKSLGFLMTLNFKSNITHTNNLVYLAQKSNNF